MQSNVTLNQPSNNKKNLRKKNIQLQVFSYLDELRKYVYVSI